jgi:uncharacterized protein YjbJ (UPF0337 family)
MNKDQLKGHVKDIAGKVQGKVGDATDDQEQQAKGMKNQAEGKLQKGYGDLKNAAQNIGKDKKD